MVEKNDTHAFCVCPELTYRIYWWFTALLGNLHDSFLGNRPQFEEISYCLRDIKERKLSQNLGPACWGLLILSFPFDSMNPKNEGLKHHVPSTTHSLLGFDLPNVTLFCLLLMKYRNYMSRNGNFWSCSQQSPKKGNWPTSQHPWPHPSLLAMVAEVWKLSRADLPSRSWAKTDWADKTLLGSHKWVDCWKQIRKGWKQATELRINIFGGFI